MTRFARLDRLPPYVIATVNELKMECRRAGEDIIDMGMGNPDLSTPPHIVEKMVEAAGKQHNHRYSASMGITRLRSAIADWYGRRFDVDGHRPKLRLGGDGNQPLDGRAVTGQQNDFVADRVALADVAALASEVSALPRLQLRGLMAVPAAGADRDTLHRDFARLREALAAIQHIAPGADTLSMGMSGDMEIAIAEGATIVRIGTAIFGPRER